MRKQNNPEEVINEQDFSDIDDMSISEPNESGIKGGVVNKDAIENDQQPISLVDYLWKHRNE